MNTLLLILAGLVLLGVFLWASQEDAYTQPKTNSLRAFMSGLDIDEELDEHAQNALPYSYLWKRK